MQRAEKYRQLYLFITGQIRIALDEQKEVAKKNELKQAFKGISEFKPDGLIDEELDKRYLAFAQFVIEKLNAYKKPRGGRPEANTATELLGKAAEYIRYFEPQRMIAELYEPADKDIDTLKQIIADGKRILASKEHETAELQAELQRVDAELTDLTGQLREQDEAAFQAERERLLEKDVAERERRALEDEKERLDRSRLGHIEKEGKLAEEKGKVEAQIEQLRERLTTMLADNARLKAKLGSAEQEALGLKQELKRSREETARAREEATRIHEQSIRYGGTPESGAVGRRGGVADRTFDRTGLFDMTGIGDVSRLGGGMNMTRVDAAGGQTERLIKLADCVGAVKGSALELLVSAVEVTSKEQFADQNMLAGLIYTIATGVEQPLSAIATTVMSEVPKRLADTFFQVVRLEGFDTNDAKTFLNIAERLEYLDALTGFYSSQNTYLPDSIRPGKDKIANRIGNSYKGQAMRFISKQCEQVGVTIPEFLALAKIRFDIKNLSRYREREIQHEGKRHKVGDLLTDDRLVFVGLIDRPVVAAAQPGASPA